MERMDNETELTFKPTAIVIEPAISDAYTQSVNKYGQLLYELTFYGLNGERCVNYNRTDEVIKNHLTDIQYMEFLRKRSKIFLQNETNYSIHINL